MPRRSEGDLIVLQAGTKEPLHEGKSVGPTIYFDGSCPLCTAEIKHYASCQGGNALTFVDVSSEGASLGQDLVANDAMQRFHVRLQDGTLVSGARAFVEIWNVLPNWQWLSRFTRLPGATSMLEFAYRLFLPVRPALSKTAGLLGARAANHQGNLSFFRASRHCEVEKFPTKNS